MDPSDPVPFHGRSRPRGRRGAHLRRTGRHAGDLAPGPIVMGLLAHHIPLTLLMDLASPLGPPSAAIMSAEGHPIGGWQHAEPITLIDLPG